MVVCPAAVGTFNFLGNLFSFMYIEGLEAGASSSSERFSSTFHSDLRKDKFVMHLCDSSVVRLQLQLELVQLLIQLSQVPVLFKVSDNQPSVNICR